MPFPFAIVCDLLEESYRLWEAGKPNRSAVESWFTRNATRVAAHDSNLEALLSTLLPEKRSDRVYFIQTQALENIVGRGLGLGISRKKELARYREPGSGVDLADCVEALLSVTPNQLHPSGRITVEEIDQLLHGLASRIKWSSPAIRASHSTLTERDRRDLERLFPRLSGIEAKWLTRLVLKSYAPVILDENQVLRLCDPCLPSLLKIRQDFAAAVSVAQAARSSLVGTSPTNAARQQFLARVKPQVGIKVGRQHWAQARSIKHCLSLVSGRVSVENKIDGEYCQIHVDLSKGDRCIQVFSKSGKDSTEDREKLHRIIFDALRIGTSDCGFSKACILEGELAVYSDLENKILPFDKIRNHVTRRGIYMATENDSPPKAHEHLMLVFFDILLVDDQSFLGVRHSERSKTLCSMVQTRKGWAELVQREFLDVEHPLAASNLRKIFARSIVNRQEGLVLKPDDVYFDFSRLHHPSCGRCIKLKKSYIGSFGDIGDFAVVGAGYDPVKAKQYGIPNLRWTHFFIGCLVNKEEVRRWRVPPKFTVVNFVELNKAQLELVMRRGNPMPAPRDDDTVRISIVSLPPVLEWRPSTRMTTVFSNPMVFDLRCFGFEKQGNMGFFSLRFPGVSKVHFDRDFTDTISFDELQETAKTAVANPTDPESQENLQWVARLEHGDPRGIAVDAASQLTATTVPTPSPRRSTQSESPVKQLVEKRAPQSSPESYRIWKKRKSGASQELGSHHDIHTLAAPRMRAPLSDTSPNALTRSSQDEVPHEGDENSPPPASVTARSGPLPSAPETDESIHSPVSSQDSQHTDLFPVARAPGDATTPSNSSQSQTSTNTAASRSSLVSIRRWGCIHAGPLCQFSKTLVLLAPHVEGTSPEARSLLKAHDINGKAIDMQTLSAGPRISSQGSDAKDGPGTILLVDSVKHGRETEALLKEMGGAVGHDGITVYDWRVLRHITIMEDDSVTRKYYDGFKDPWRRWYCGLV